MMASTHTTISTSLSTSTSASENMERNARDSLSGSQQTPLELPFAYPMSSLTSNNESKHSNRNYVTNVNIRDSNERDVLSSSPSSSFIPAAHEKSLEYHFNPDHYRYTRPADIIQNENSSERVNKQKKTEEEDYCTLDYPRRNNHHRNLQANSSQNKSIIQNIRPTMSSNTSTNVTPSSISIMPPDTYRYGPDLLSHLLDSGTDFFTKSFDLNSSTRGEQSRLLSNCETAKKAAKEASFFLQKGELDKALIKYTAAAKAYRDIALAVQDYDTSLCNSLLLLSQAQARNGTSLLELHQSNTIHINTFRDTKEDKDSENISTLLSSKSSYNDQISDNQNELSSPHKQKNITSKSTKNIDVRNNDTSTNVKRLALYDNISGQKNDKLLESTQNSTNTHSFSSKERSSNESSASNAESRNRLSIISNEEKIRATIRGALNDDKKEADITDSTFLGMATKNTSKDIPNTYLSGTAGNKNNSHETNNQAANKNDVSNGNYNIGMNQSTSETNVNPVDDLIKLEKELKNMDMALQLGNSMASLSLPRTNSSRLKQSMLDDGSFCVIRPASNSKTTGSVMITPPILPLPPPSPSSLSLQHTFNNKNDNCEAGIRARASRIHPLHSRNDIASSFMKSTSQHQSQSSSSKFPPNIHHNDDISLDASWWGNSSIHSSSNITAHSNSNISTQIYQNYEQNNKHMHNESSPLPNNVESTATNTKQVMRLLDSLKTLGDENAALLKEVEEAHAARLEAKAAREQMKSFKAEYGKRFIRLKAALDKLRKDFANKNEDNLLNSSNFVRSKAEADAKKKDQMIEKLANDLRKERDESKKKDIALRKYENFYKEVKLKALQKQKEQEKMMRFAGTKGTGKHDK